MYTFLLVALAMLLILALVVLNRRLHAAITSNRLNADRITWHIVGIVAACAGIGVALQLLANLHGLE